MGSHHFAVSNALKKEPPSIEVWPSATRSATADDDATNCVVRIMANGDQTKRLHTKNHGGLNHTWL